MRQIFTQKFQAFGRNLYGLIVLCLMMVPVFSVGQNYCSVSGQDPCGGFPDYIERVSLSDLDNSTGCGGVYNDFTNLSASVTAGQFYQLVVEEQSSEYVRVWIDYNGNKQFEPSESVGFNNSYDGIDTRIRIPCSAIDGSTRMRVRSANFGTPLSPSDACGRVNDETETEDYTVNINNPQTAKTLISSKVGQQIIGKAFPGQNLVTNTELFLDFDDNCGKISLDTLFLSHGKTTNPQQDLNAVKLAASRTQPTRVDPTTFNNGDVIETTRNFSGSAYTLAVNEDIQDFQQYLYILHDLSANAQRGNLVDVSIDSFVVNGKTVVPSTNNPGGVIDILGSKSYCSAPSLDRQNIFLIGIDSFRMAGSDWFVSNPPQGSGPDWYTNFNNTDIVVQRKDTVDFDVVVGPINDARVRGFIDWNNNGILEPTREEVIDLDNIKGPNSGEIPVPCYADTGAVLKLRIGSNLNGETIGPCTRYEEYFDGSKNGEYEDYRIRVNPVPAANPSFAAPDTFFVNSPKSLTSTHVKNRNLTYEWDVDNDGNYEKQGFSVSQTYTSTGSRQVTLKVTRNACSGQESETRTKSIVVVRPNNPPEVDFLANKNVIPVNRTVSFTDYTEEGPVSWEWSIGPAQKNGRKTAEFVNSNKNSQNPEVKFLQPGKYSVTLKATNQVGSNSKTITNYIQVNDGVWLCREQVVTKKSGFVYDDGGPNGKTPESTSCNNCSMVINPNCADSTTLQFNLFNMTNIQCANAPYPTCPNPDNIKIWDGTSSNGIPLHIRNGAPDGFTNGNGPPRKLTAQSGSFYIEYEAGGCANAEGFAAEWEAFQSAPASAKKQIRQNEIKGPDTLFQSGVGVYDNTVDYPGATVNFVFPSGEVLQANDDPARKQIDVDPGDYKVSVIISYCGFKDTATQSVHIEPVKQKPTVKFTASKKEVFIGDTVQLIDQSFNGINNWQWRVGSGVNNDPITFVKGSDANSESPYIVFEEVGSYRVELIATNKRGRSVGVKLNFIEVIDLCTPSARFSTEDLSINNFRLKEVGQSVLIDNSTGYDDDDNYSNFSYPNTQLEAGRTYEVSIQRSSSFNPVSYVVYTDLNKDGKLDNSEILVSNASVNGRAYTDTFTLPANLEGGFNRLRVAAGAAGQISAPCGSATGEYEDYKLPVVEDQTPPAISLRGPSNVTVRACGNLSFTQGAVATDIVDGNLTSEIQKFGGFDSTRGGTYEVTYQVSDNAGNEASVTQNITVLPDTTKPSISLKGNQTLQVEVFNPLQDPGVNASDNCSGLKGVNISNPVQTDIIGTYQQVYTAVDNAGNKRSVTRTINVVDNEDPELKVLGTDTVTVPVFGSYQDPGVSIRDNYYDSADLTVNGQVNLQDVGTYQLEYVATDQDGNTTRANRIVKVVDNTAPEFTNVDEGIVTLDVNNRFTYPYGVTDNYYPRSRIDLVDRGGTFFNQFQDGIPDTLGIFNARFTFEDGSGNQNSIRIPVKVVDREAPTINLNRDVVNLNRYQRYQDSLGETYTLNDNYFAAEAITVERSGNYFTDYLDSNFRQGLYEIRYQAIDPEGNASNIKVRGINVRFTGIDDKFGETAIEVYPNPTDGKVNVDIGNLRTQPTRIEVINTNGQAVRVLTPANNGAKSSLNFDLSGEAKGLYNIKVQSGDKTITKPIIVQ